MTVAALPLSLPLALSLSSSFTKIGAIAAFAALVGIAALALLVSTQARELKRLREWAGRAPERAAEQEQRVSAEAAVGLARTAPGAPPVRQVPRTIPLNARPITAGGQPATAQPVAPTPEPAPGMPAPATPSPAQIAAAAAARARRPEPPR